MMFWRKRIEHDIERLDNYKASRVSFEALRDEHFRLREEFNALVKSLGVSVKRVPSRIEVEQEAKR